MNEEPIDRFEGEFRFLSNFYPCLIEWEGIHYESVENAYQASKTEDLATKHRFTLCSAAQAKKLGRKVQLIHEWDGKKISVMQELLMKKFHPGSQLALMLLATGSRPLFEGNWWGDRFWGVYNGEGQNNLGKLLEQVRQRLVEVGAG